jgi:hypothetical protein
MKMRRKKEKRKSEVLSELRSCYSLSLSAPPPPPRALPHRVETSLRPPFPHTDRRCMHSLLLGKKTSNDFLWKGRNQKQQQNSKLSLSLSLSLCVSCLLCSQWCSQTVVVETAAMEWLDPTKSAPGRKGSKRWKQQQNLRARTWGNKQEDTGDEEGAGDRFGSDAQACSLTGYYFFHVYFYVLRRSCAVTSSP